MGVTYVPRKINYRKWLELWNAIESKNVARKMDQQGMLIFFNIISNEVTHELDVEKETKKTWNTLKVESGGMTQIRKAHVQYFKRYNQNLFMDEGNLFLDFFEKLSCVVNVLRSLGEVITNVEGAAKLL